ncbi:MAG: hypothetical protein GY868_14130 [Deltaproteobacteria bacterium]|nr:hypothetical protein [Deltaproteobacteria bacterium]
MDMTHHEFVFTPRNFREIPIWESVTDEQWHDPHWQLENSITDVETLSGIIQLSAHQKNAIHDTLEGMRSQGKEPMRIPPYYASLMAQNPFDPTYPDGEHLEDKLDPIFWQSVPTPAHLLFPQAGVEQSMAESERTFGAFYQRYPNRGALFVCENTSCASFCTHCQRTKSLDTTARITRDALARGLFYISRNENINEVLVTGGDALRISKERFFYVIGELCKMPNVKCIRIATRVPVVLPMSVTDDLLSTIDDTIKTNTRGVQKNVYFMTHVNHYHEITPDFIQCIQKIKQHGYAIRNQTVFLNHVNADFYTLAETFRRMWWAGVAPYYLLQCHNEKGLTHFIAPIHLGKYLTKHLHGWISGTCRPTYSANLEGGGGKVTLTPSGYDINDETLSLEQKASKVAVTIHTWDDKIMRGYEALGRATQAEYDQARKVMDSFIGKRNIFKPAVIIIGENGAPVRATRQKLPKLTNSLKADLLGYTKESDGMPLTNPADIEETLEKEFRESDYSRTGNH